MIVGREDIQETIRKMRQAGQRDSTVAVACPMCGKAYGIVVEAAKDDLDAMLQREGAKREVKAAVAAHIREECTW